MKDIFKGHKAVIVNQLFQVLLVTYLVLLLVEELWQGTVSNYLNINYLLVVVIILGILDIFSENTKKENKPITKKDYLFVIVLSIAGFLIIKFKTSALGWLSWLISIIAGVLIALLSVLVLEDKEDEMD